MRYLITGHTGFKGSWLSALLKINGHEVHGISLAPDKHSHFNQANVSKYLDGNHFEDIRKEDALMSLVRNIKPEVVIHLAAQPLVRRSYIEPLYTYEVNVIGTLNCLKACQVLDNLKAVLIVTTDKVYKNRNQMIGYVESDELGGVDPYSASKACADIATQSWRESFPGAPIAIARAGNVIGGGDWAKDRLIPDLVNALENQNYLKIRNPRSIRPWQHVLDCLNGYNKLISYQLKNSTGGDWNFGPQAKEFKSVETLTNDFVKIWDKKIEIIHEESSLKESNILTLNSDKSRAVLGWNEKLDYFETLEWTAEWYKRRTDYDITALQIEKYLNL